jgi:hypothetical protein
MRLSAKRMLLGATPVAIIGLFIAIAGRLRRSRRTPQDIARTGPSPTGSEAVEDTVGKEDPRHVPRFTCFFVDLFERMRSILGSPASSVKGISRQTKENLDQAIRSASGE